MSDIKKAVLAYSGGLDTSVILKWLQDTYACEIVTFTADLGQGEELEPARAKALQFGIKPEHIFIDDLRSMDANLLHISFEGRHLEDPNAEAEEAMWRWTVSPEKAPDKAQVIEIEFKNGDPVAINGKAMKAHELLAELNRLGGANGIGRLDLVENRFVGMKSRGCYETPGGTILLKAHRAIESITLDREVAHLKDDLMPRYATLIYNGYWWSPERIALQTLIDHTQKSVNGNVRLKLYKGSVSVLARDSVNTLFDQNIATFDDDGGAYNQADAGGFIKLNALRMRIAEIAKRKRAK